MNLGGVEDRPPPLSPRRGALLQRRPAVRETAGHLFQRMRARMVRLFPPSLNDWVLSASTRRPVPNPSFSADAISGSRASRPAGPGGISGCLGARDLLVVGVSESTKRLSQHDEDWLYRVIAQHVLDGGVVHCVSTPAAYGLSRERVAHEMHDLNGFPSGDAVQEEVRRGEGSTRAEGHALAVEEEEEERIWGAMWCHCERCIRLHSLEDWSEWNELMETLKTSAVAKTDGRNGTKNRSQLSIGEPAVELPPVIVPDNSHSHVCNGRMKELPNDNTGHDSPVVPLVVIHLHTAYLLQWERFTGKQVALLPSLLELQNRMKCALIVVEQQQIQPAYPRRLHTHPPRRILSAAPSLAYPGLYSNSLHTEPPFEGGNEMTDKRDAVSLCSTEDEDEDEDEEALQTGPADGSVEASSRQRGTVEAKASDLLFYSGAERKRPRSHQEVRYAAALRSAEPTGGSPSRGDADVCSHSASMGNSEGCTGVSHDNPSSNGIPPADVVERLVVSSDLLSRMLSLARDSRDNSGTLSRHDRFPNRHSSRSMTNHFSHRGRKNFLYGQRGTPPPARSPLCVPQSMVNLEGLTIWYLQLDTTLLPPRRSGPKSLASRPAARDFLSSAALRQQEVDGIDWEQEACTRASMFQLVLQRAPPHYTSFSHSHHAPHEEDDWKEADNMNRLSDATLKERGLGVASTNLNNKDKNWPPFPHKSENLQHMSEEFRIHCTRFHTCDHVFTG